MVSVWGHLVKIFSKSFRKNVVLKKIWKMTVISKNQVWIGRLKLTCQLTLTAQSLPLKWTKKRETKLLNLGLTKKKSVKLMIKRWRLFRLPVNTYFWPKKNIYCNVIWVVTFFSFLFFILFFINFNFYFLKAFISF